MKRMSLAIAAAVLAAGSVTSLSAQSFGNAMAVVGEQILVGEPVYEMRSGVVYVFAQDGSGSWEKTQRIESPSGEMGDRFGIRLASQDGLLLVSATRVENGTGTVYMFQNDDGTWNPAGELQTDDRSPADSLGSGLAIDGDWIMVGTIAQNGGRGAAYAFRRDGDGWVQHSRMAPATLSPEDRFGSTIAVNGDHMMITAASADDDQGAVYAYEYDEATDEWTPMGPLQAPLVNAQAAYGSDIVIDGDIALVGSPGNIVGIGSVMAYGFVEGQWELGTMLIPYEAAAQTGFGGTIAFDGETALIGAATANFGEGRMFAYTLDPETLEWSSVTKVVSGAPTQELFAATVAMGDGLAVGSAPGADNDTGAAWVLEWSEDGWSPTGRIGGDMLGIAAINGDEVRCSDEGEAALFECSSVDLLSFVPLGDMAADRGITTNDVPVGHQGAHHRLPHPGVVLDHENGRLVLV